MKKLLFIFAIIFIFSFAFACGEKEDEKKQDDNKQEEQKPDEPKDEPEEPETKEFTVKFVVDGEKTIVKVVEGEKAIKPSDPVKDGYIFVGWFLGDEKYNFESLVTSDMELTAKFEKIVLEELIINVTEYTVNEGEGFLLEYEVKNKKEGTFVVIESLDNEVLEVSGDNVIGLKEGTGTLKVYLNSSTDYIIITVNVLEIKKPQVYITNKPDKIGMLEKYTLDIEVLNSDSKVIYESLDENIVDINNGVLEGVNTGSTTITVMLEDNNEIMDSFDVEVFIDPVIIFDTLIIDDVLVKEVTTYGENPKIQKQLVLGSVSRYLFNEVEIIKEFAPIDQNEYTGETATKEMLEIVEPKKLVRPGIKLEELKYIIYHDTGNANSGADAKMHANYMVSSDNRNNRARSWHYTVGDKVIYQHIPTDEITWQGDSYDAYAKSIGIETCVNYGADLYSVWQNTAKLMSSLIIENNLSIDSVKQHYDMSGKNCPQTLRSNNLYSYAISLIEGELLVSSLLKDYKLQFESLNPEYLDNTGKVIKQPEVGTRLAYKVTFIKGSEKISKVYYSNITGADGSSVNVNDEDIKLANEFDQKVVSKNLKPIKKFLKDIEALVNEYHSLDSDVQKLCGTKDYLLNLEYELFKNYESDNKLYINEIYNNSSNLNNTTSYNYIELYNNTEEVIDLSGYEIVIVSLDNEEIYKIKNGKIYPYCSFIIGFGSPVVEYNFNIDYLMPIPDGASSINIPDDNYSIILKNNEKIIDTFGINNATLFEGATFKTESVEGSISRKHYIDTDDNSRDFYNSNISPINSSGATLIYDDFNIDVFLFDYQVVLMNRELDINDEEVLNSLKTLYELLSESDKKKVKTKELLDELLIELEGIKNPSIKIVHDVIDLIPKRITDDYKLPSAEGVSYKFIDSEGKNYYNIETGEYLKLSYEAKIIKMEVTHGNYSQEISINFGVADVNDKIIYNTGTVKPSGGKTADGYGTLSTQLSKTGFGGVAIRVDNKVYFIGDKCLININGDSGKQSLTKKELRPLGGENMINNCGIVNGVATEYKGTGALYYNNGSVNVTFDLSDTYGRNNSGVYGYFKVTFSKNNYGEYYVSKVHPNTGTNTSTDKYYVTLKPGEYLWCPHTYETNVDGGTWFMSPSTSTSGGVLTEGKSLEIIYFKK